MSKLTKKVVDNLIQEMQQRPDDFVFGHFTMTDKKTKAEYWTCNGILFGGVDSPVDLHFGIIQSIRFHAYLKKFKAWRAMNLAAE